MFRVFREEIRKSTVKYRTPSLGPERLNMDGVYQTFKTLQVNGKPMPIYFHSFIFRWIQLKMTILRKKKVRRKIFPISEAESWNSSVPHWFFTFFCSRKHAFRLFAEAYVTQAGFFFTAWTGRETSWKQFHVTTKLTRWLRCCYGIHIARYKQKDGSIVWMFCENFDIDIACLFSFQTML